MGNKILVRLYGFRSFLKSVRALLFMKTRAAAVLLWIWIVLVAVYISFGCSAVTVLLTIGVLALLLPWVLHWVLANRYRLVQKADQIEFADVILPEDGVVQQFEKGVVLERLTREEAERSGLLTLELMDRERWFFLVRTPQKTTLVALAWVVAIETDEGY